MNIHDIRKETSNVGNIVQVDGDIAQENSSTISFHHESGRLT